MHTTSVQVAGLTFKQLLDASAGLRVSEGAGSDVASSGSEGPLSLRNGTGSSTGLRRNMLTNGLLGRNEQPADPSSMRPATSAGERTGPARGEQVAGSGGGLEGCCACRTATSGGSRSPMKRSSPQATMQLPTVRSQPAVGKQSPCVDEPRPCSAAVSRRTPQR